MPVPTLPTIYRWLEWLVLAGNWLVWGGIAALWWVPKFLGETKPIPWQMGAVCLAVLWTLVFNHWPRVGTRKFFRENRFIAIKLAGLLFVSAFFALGFALV